MVVFGNEFKNLTLDEIYDFCNKNDRPGLPTYNLILRKNERYSEEHYKVVLTQLKKCKITNGLKKYSVRCYLNGQISYQAQGFYSTTCNIKIIIDKIAGGEIDI